MKGCRPLTDAEVAIVAQSFGGTYATRDRALFVLGIKTGFRISELLSLTIGDVYQHGQVVARVTVKRAHMKRKVEGRTLAAAPRGAGGHPGLAVGAGHRRGAAAIPLSLRQSQGRQPADFPGARLAYSQGRLRHQRLERGLGHTQYAQDVCQSRLCQAGP